MLLKGFLAAAALATSITASAGYILNVQFMEEGSPGKGDETDDRNQRPDFGLNGRLCARFGRTVHGFAYRLSRGRLTPSRPYPRETAMKPP